MLQASEHITLASMSVMLVFLVLLWGMFKAEDKETTIKIILADLSLLYNRMLKCKESELPDTVSVDRSNPATAITVKTEQGSITIDVLSTGVYRFKILTTDISFTTVNDDDVYLLSGSFKALKNICNTTEFQTILETVRS